MSDDIQVHCYPDNRQLTLTCGPEAFARVLSAVIAEAGPLAVDPAVMRLVLIERLPPARTPTWWNYDRVALIGCAMIAFVPLFVFAIGVSTIAGWLR